MENQSWFENVEGHLRHQWLPLSYRRRILQELRDHARDVLDGEDDQADAQSNKQARFMHRLGEWHGVADVIVQTYRKRSFIGRHPVLVFGVSPLFLGPLFLGPLLWALLVTGVLHLLAFFFDPSDLSPSVLLLSNPFIHWIVMNILPMPILVLYAWLALRYSKPWKSLFSSIFILTLFFCSMLCRPYIPVEEGAQAMVTWAPLIPPPFPFRALPLLIAVGVFTLMMLRHQRQRAVT
jgi:hypothetical protein